MTKSSVHQQDKQSSKDACAVCALPLSRVQLFATPWMCSPRNSPGQNTRAVIRSLLQGIFPTRDRTQVEPRSIALEVDSLPAEPQGKPKNTGVGNLLLLQGIFPTQELNQGLLHSRWTLPTELLGKLLFPRTHHLSQFSSQK